MKKLLISIAVFSSFTSAYCQSFLMDWDLQGSSGLGHLRDQGITSSLGQPFQRSVWANELNGLGGLKAEIKHSYGAGFGQLETIAEAISGPRPSPFELINVNTYFNFSIRDSVLVSNAVNGASLTSLTGRFLLTARTEVFAAGMNYSGVAEAHWGNLSWGASANQVIERSAYYDFAFTNLGAGVQGQLLQFDIPFSAYNRGYALSTSETGSTVISKSFLSYQWLGLTSSVWSDGTTAVPDVISTTSGLNYRFVGVPEPNSSIVLLGAIISLVASRFSFSKVK